MELGLVRKIDIDHEMQQAYLDYAMSVIVARALPDARDGMKPVQRRILYAMYDMGIRADTPYKKSARIVGEVLGKYHPHGDSSVYEAMARLAQDFSMRTMLVDGQGNFGSVDGDPPAAMRYTEARLAAPALDILADINKNTVDFVANFDDTLTEPSVLPAAIPNLLVNGATGIAVGMATSIPPHNLGEIVDACVYMLDRWEKLDDIDVEQLMEFVLGPDFPTGGVIIQEKGDEGIESAYGSGRGRITVQAKAHVEEMERGKSRIIVTELPYTVNKSSLIERIAELARDGHFEGLSDLRDESDRRGMRIVLELTKNADPEVILRDLYKRTPMQTTFSINLLALVDGEPRTLTLKQALRVYLEHRLTVIKRRAQFDLDKAEARQHILEGYLVALKNLDEIIHLIRNAADVETARAKLMKRYKLTELQANAILDMQLRRLAALERKKIETEYKEVSALIKDLKALLKSQKLMRGAVAEELLKVKSAYADRRRTQIVNLKKGKAAKMLTATDLLPDQMVWVGVTADGLIARTHDDKQPKHSGHDAPRWLARASTSDTLYLAAENGRCAAVALHVIPEAEKLSDGAPYHKVSPLEEDDALAAMFALPARKSEFPEETCVVTMTRFGMIKKSLVSELPGPSAQAFTLVKVNEEDRLGWVGLTDGKKKEILLVTSGGMAIRFKEEDVRPMGLVAAGVNGIKLDEQDEVIGAEILPAEGEIFLLASDGKAKRVSEKEFPAQGRYGKGVRAWDLPRKVTLVGAVSGKPNHLATVVLEKGAPKSTRLDAAAVRKRAASKGDVIVEMKKDEAILSVSVAWTAERFVKREEERKQKAEGGKRKAEGGKRKATAKSAKGKKK
ncbi:MAG: DNA gyrase subunit A [Anaerolineaceae bacterium]|nr:DNA gyrase subunit A [Anaerolineae bacterium]MBL1171107.1 DNA gyrase subunit A [Chloroflexota bacterium]MDL1926828.1 DNA gyrase subunit A [Anaerolineae bacterium AMX1]WKZ53847.1 MAG: DNA gyrase subunit A [Anaerolineales bacterium]GJQ38834.1 MAG: DNA gyrase subunit A [Anaerolineaceae bacterium]